MRSERKEFEEIEFVCANPSFPDYEETLDKHRLLHDRLRGKEGLVVYRQESTDGLSALSVILNRKNKKFVMRQASEIDLPVDGIVITDNCFVNDALRKKLRVS